MKKIITIVIILLLGIVLFWLIYTKLNSNDIVSNNDNNIDNSNTNINNETEDLSMKLYVNNYEFEVILDKNITTNALMDMLPLDIEMSELNGNEKYFYLSDTLPTNSENVGHISAGDIMLYGNNCLVIFYESFNTSYSYTKIGKIKDVSNLKEALGNNNVNVRWEK